MKENWKVVSYAPKYMISDIGNVMRISDGAIIKPYITNNGYLRVNLCIGYKKRTQKLIHKLVADMFLDVVIGKPYINHKDGDKFKNITSNLEWCTASENMKHAYDLGLKPKMFGNTNRKKNKIKKEVK